MTGRPGRPASRGAARSRVDWGRLEDLDLPDLEPHVPGTPYDGVTVEELLRDEVGPADGLVLRESRLRGCRAGTGRARRLRATTVAVDDCTSTSLDLADAVLRDVAVRGGRHAALLAPGSQLERVSVRGARLDFVGLRGARLTAVQLVDCRIGELDLSGAELLDVRLDGSTVDRLVLREARCRGVDLRGATLGAVEGADGLPGTRVSSAQLLALAHGMAAHLGIAVDDAAL